MNGTDLDRLLSLGRESDSAPPEMLDAVLAQLSENARQQAARSPRSRRPRRTWGIAAGVTVLAGAVVMTAGSFYPSPPVDADAVIPISYVTDTGKQVQCTFTLRATSWDGGDATALAEFIARHDWTGVGQRGYDYALTHPISRDDPGMDPTISDVELERSSVSRGISTTIGAELPVDLVIGPGVGTGATSTCRWELH